MQSWGGKINKKNLNVKWRFLTFYQMLMEPENYLFGCSVFTFFSPLCDQKEQFLQNIIYYYRKKEAVYISYRELNLYLTHNMIILQPNPIHISISCNLKKNQKKDAGSRQRILLFQGECYTYIDIVAFRITWQNAKLHRRNVDFSTLSTCVQCKYSRLCVLKSNKLIQSSSNRAAFVYVHTQLSDFTSE